MTTWTPERLQALEEIWNGPFDIHEILKHLNELTPEAGTITRRAAVSQARRIGLPSRGRRTRRIEHTSRNHLPSKERSERHSKKKRGVPFLELEPRMCKWAVGEDTSVGVNLFCGKQIEGKGSYCEEHSSSAHQNPRGYVRHARRPDKK